MDKPYAALAGAAITFVVLVFFIDGLDYGFSSGARQATDQILSSTVTDDEVVILRAELEQMRRAEDRFANVLVAAFTAGVAVLALLNVGIVITSQRNYDRDMQYMRVTLLEDAKTLDAERAAQAARELSMRDEWIPYQIQDANSQVEARIGARMQGLESRIDMLVDTTQQTGSMVSVLEANYYESMGEKYEARRWSLNAADAFSRWARWYAENGMKSYSTVALVRVIDNLKQVTPTDFKPKETLESISENLARADKAPPVDERISTLCTEAQVLIEKIRNMPPHDTETWPEPTSYRSVSGQRTLNDPASTRSSRRSTRPRSP